MALTLKQKIIKAMNPILFPLARIYWRIRKPVTYGVKVIVQHADKYLIIQNSYGFKRLTFPGGKIEEGEVASHAAIRETKEEVGIRLGEVRKLFDVTSTAEGKVDHVAIFHAVADSDKLSLCEFEIASANWFTKEEIPDLSPFAEEVWSRFIKSELKSNDRLSRITDL